MAKLKSFNRSHTVPCWLAPIVFILCVLIFSLVYLNYWILPTPKVISEQTLNDGSFVAEQSMVYLRNLTSIGVRVGGSYANDVQTVDLLKNIIEKEIIAVYPNDNLIAEVDVQRASGSFELEFSPYGMTTVYKDVQNVIVRLRGRSFNEDSSCIMLNSHYDTMPDTEGASDAGAMIAIMLEILRVMYQSRELSNCLVFLLNGGEENYMLGSHAFVTQHDWAKQVKFFINMDAAGAGGKEIMFQAGPEYPFLTRQYHKSAPHRHAAAMGEELFQLNMIPSDSDFRIFRDFGNIPGMDFAFNANGYVYHTKYDVVDAVPLGTLQHTGDNILALVKSVANDDNLNHLNDEPEFRDGKLIFYDFLGWFMIIYAEETGIILNYSLAGVGLILIFLSMWSMSCSGYHMTLFVILKEFAMTIIVQVLSVAVAFGVAVALAYIYDATGKSMSWYSFPALLFGIYLCPFLCAISVGPLLWINGIRKKTNIYLGHKVQLFLHAQALILIIILTGLTGLYRTAYMLTIPVLFYLIGVAFNLMAGWQNTRHKWIWTHMATQIIPLMFYSSMVHLALQTFIPITGRDGPDSNPEILVMLFVIGLGYIASGFLTPLIALCRKPYLVILMYGVIAVCGFILLATKVSFPYHHAFAPQRYWIQHTHRKMHYGNSTLRREENGYYVQAMDRNTPSSVQGIVPEFELDTTYLTGNDCERELYCGLPLLSSRKHGKSDVSFWIPIDDTPNYSAPAQLVSASYVYEGNRGNATYKITGPPHMGFFISPVVGIKLIDWTLLDYIPKPGPMWNNRETFFVFFNYGYHTDPKEFEFTINYQCDTAEWPEQVFDIALTSHYLFHEDQRTTEFNRFIASFPDWTYQFAWFSSYESFIINRS